MAIVEILLPVRDGAPTLGEALRSVREQTLEDFRCLVLDDGSTDATAQIAAELARRDPRFVVETLPARGIVDTLNAGLERCEAPFVARLDADDLLEPRRLEIQVRELQGSGSPDVVSCRVAHFGEGISENLRIYEDWLNSTMTHDEIVRDLFVESPLAHPSVTMRTASLRGVGGYRDVGFPEDYDLWLRGWRAGWRFAKVEDTLVRIRQHPGRLTWTDQRYTARAFLECKAAHLADAFDLRERGAVVWGAGRDGKRAAKALRRLGVPIRHLVDIAPTKVGRRMIGLDVKESGVLERKTDAFVVAAVGIKGARSRIREALRGWSYEEGADFVCFG